MRKIKKYRYVAAFALTAMVFLLGILMSNLVDQQRAQSLENEMQQDLIQLESNQLQLSYLRSDESSSCEALQTALKNIVIDYNQRLSNVQNFQSDSFFKSQDFENIKRRYILSGIRYWMFAEEVRQKCDYSPDTVLFFTTTLDKDDCPECDKIGRRLTLLKRKYNGDLLIFSIPVRMEDGMVDVLEQQFNVAQTPAVVINGDHKMTGLHPRSAIEQQLNNSAGE